MLKVTSILLVLPQLQLVSKVTAFPNSPIKLMYSSDCKWVYVSTQNSHPYPKVSACLAVYLWILASWEEDKAVRCGFKAA